MRISTLPTLWSNFLTILSIGLPLFSTSKRLDIPLLIGLFLSVSLMYLAGMVLNDFFDVKVDAQTRPEKPIPSGRISARSAGIFGFILLGSGLTIGLLSTPSSAGLMAVLLAASILGYDACFKRLPFVGPFAMGACRLFHFLFLVWATDMTCPVIYVVFVTLYIVVLTFVSRYEDERAWLQRYVGLALSLLIPLDAAFCLIYLGLPAGFFPAVLVLSLFPLARALRKIVPLS